MALGNGTGAEARFALGETQGTGDGCHGFAGAGDLWRKDVVVQKEQGHSEMLGSLREGKVARLSAVADDGHYSVGAAASLGQAALNKSDDLVGRSFA
nr:hypothetical protein [Devosia submarina]